MKQIRVQILVVVANIQMRTLKTEVEKGSMRTAFGHGSVDPETSVNVLFSSDDVCLFLFFFFFLKLLFFRKKR